MVDASAMKKQDITIHKLHSNLMLAYQECLRRTDSAELENILDKFLIVSTIATSSKKLASFMKTRYRGEPELYNESLIFSKELTDGDLIGGLAQLISEHILKNIGIMALLTGATSVVGFLSSKLLGGISTFSDLYVGWLYYKHFMDPALTATTRLHSFTHNTLTEVLDKPEKELWGSTGAQPPMRWLLHSICIIEFMVAGAFLIIPLIFLFKFL